LGAKVIYYRNAWWVRTHVGGQKIEKRFGPTAADKRAAQELIREINHAIGLKQWPPKREEPLPVDLELRRWLEAWTPAMKSGYCALVAGVINTHLVPFLGSRDLHQLREEDLLRYVRAKLDAGLAPATIRRHLASLQRVLSIAHREGKIPRNPAARLGELMRRVERVAAHEAPEAEAWTREEVATLLAVAHELEPRVAPLLHFLLATGCRRGEALGLKWEDVDFARGRIVIRRAVTSRELTTPKSGKGRMVAMPPALAAELFDLLALREREAKADGVTRLGREVPEWVFSSLAGTHLDERNLTRSWYRVRRRAAKLGVRPLKLHAARHTYASLALAAGKSIRWVAAQLGHASPAFTLRTYAYAMPDEEVDLGFAEFDAVTLKAVTLEAVARRRYPSPQKKERSARHANPSDLLVELGGIEPPTPRLPALCSPS